MSKQLKCLLGGILSVSLGLSAAFVYSLEYTYGRLTISIVSLVAALAGIGLAIFSFVNYSRDENGKLPGQARGGMATACTGLGISVICVIMGLLHFIGSFLG